MTRINAGIPVEYLSDQHLLAEHREIKRIPNTKFNSIPTKEFTLGKGHVLFFIDKNNYTLNRYIEIYQECLKRNFNVTNYSDCWNKKEETKDKAYIPTSKDMKLVIDRIISNVILSKQTPRYYGIKITKEIYINKLGNIVK
jgi:hypothetical protein